MALVNQQAASSGLPPVGNVNPALYRIAQGPDYTLDFHDVVAGDNTSSFSPGQFYAVSGYDLCTGWGSPAGQHLIDDLTTRRAGLCVTPALGFTAIGLAGGAFDVTNSTFVLAASGSEPLSWALINPSGWLDACPASGSLAPLGPEATVTVSLNAAAGRLGPGTYTATLWFTNETTGLAEARDFVLQVQPSASVQATIAPADAASAGATWQVDNGPWQASGATASGLAEGFHTITFSSVSNWLAPSSSWVSVDANQTAEVTGTYVSAGWLQVSLGPAGLPTEARWRADVGPWQTNAAQLQIAAGTHSINFSGVDGWGTPTPLSVTVVAGRLSATNAAYIPMGLLQVTLEPAGGWWQIDDGGPWFSSGETVTTTPGGHRVRFDAADGYNAPESQSVTVSLNQKTMLDLVCAPQTGQLQVFLSPPEAVAVGARWQLDDGPWQTNGAIGTYSLTFAPHTLCFSSAGRWAAPPAQPIWDFWQNTVTAVYAEAYQVNTIAGVAGNPGTIDGVGTEAHFNNPMGMAVDANGNVYVADGGNATIRQLIPTGTNWVVTTIAGIAGNPGSADGQGDTAQFNSPSGLAVDASGNLFVVDTGNNAIRQLKLTETGWVVSTIAGQAGSSGNCDGTGVNARLNRPTGIAAGPDGCLYVTDTGNYIVRKLTVAGSDWRVTTIAGRGFGWAEDGIGTNAGFVEPSGIAVGSGGRLFVVDSGALTIRQLAASGPDWVVTSIAGTAFGMGTQDGSNATFWSPYAINIDAHTNLYVTDSCAIRKIAWRDGGWFATTIGGQQYSPGTVDGVNQGAAFCTPQGLAVDHAGRLFIADSRNDTIRLGAQTLVSDLQVTLQPPAAVQAGARWCLDGGAWQYGGTTIPNVSTGLHTISFSSVNNWATPSNQVVMVTTNGMTAVTGEYVAGAGALQVMVYPDDAVNAGAQWRVDQGSWQTNGATVSNLLFGSHAVSFLAVSNWAAPAELDVSINAGQTLVTSATYSPAGSVCVTISPAAALEVGAQWILDDGDWQTNGATVFGVGYGSHWITFSTVEGWEAPAPQEISVGSSQPIPVTGTYEPLGRLQVNVEPSNAVSGGCWQVDQGDWLTNGATVALGAGSHDIEFGNAILPDWNPPDPQTVTVYSNQLTVVSAVCLPRQGTLQVTLSPSNAVSAGALWQVDAGPWQASGNTVSALPGGHVVSFKPIPGWNTPASQTVAVVRDSACQTAAAYTRFESNAPTVTILTPSATNQSWSYPELTVAGTARDDVAVQKVWCRLNAGAWLTAHGTTNWASSVTLSPGTNWISVYAMDASGNISAIRTAPAVYIPRARLELEIAGAGKVAPALAGQLLVIGQSYAITANPGAGWVFSCWTGSVTNSMPTLTFVMQSNTVLHANFVPSPLVPVAGTYTGLFSVETNVVSQQSSGAFTLTATPKGAFSGSLYVNGARYSLSGQFDAAGHATLTIPPRSSTPLTVDLQLDLSQETDHLSGTVSNPSWTAQLDGERAVFDGKIRIAPSAGKYTLAIFGNEDSASAPGGYSYGTLAVSKAGKVSLSGSLADGTKISQAATVSQSGRWPLYVSLYSGHGLIWSRIDFTNSPAVSLVGQLAWIKPPLPGAKCYPAGFAFQTTAWGSVYVPPPAGTWIIALSNADLVLDGAGLAQTFISPVAIDSRNRATCSNKACLTFTLSTGRFSGSVPAAGNSKPLSFSGVVLQNQDIGAGFFLNTNQSGEVYLGR